MNTTYLLIMGLSGLYTLIQIFVVPNSEYTNSSLRVSTTFISGIVFAIMLVLSGIIGGYDMVETKPATNTKVGDELVITSVGWPTQIVSDIKFVEKEVQIKKVIEHNAWGGEIITTYTVILNESEKP